MYTVFTMTKDALANRHRDGVIVATYLRGAIRVQLHVYQRWRKREWTKDESWPESGLGTLKNCAIAESVRGSHLGSGFGTSRFSGLHLTVPIKDYHGLLL